jgi:hypothetical protein
MALGGAWCGVGSAGGVHRLTGLDGPWLLVLAILCALGGAVVGLTEAGELNPMSSSERRDALLGWSAAGALAVALAFAVLVGWWHD